MSSVMGIPTEPARGNVYGGHAVVEGEQIGEDEDSPRTRGEAFPGYQHEAGDRAFVVAQHFNDFVQEHPFIQERPDLAALADQIGDMLADLYQAIWRAKE